jgi:hypothetical protein
VRSTACRPTLEKKASAHHRTTLNHAAQEVQEVFPRPRSTLRSCGWRPGQAPESQKDPGHYIARFGSLASRKIAVQ